MSEDHIFKQLEEVLKELSIEIKFRKGYFTSGLCRYREKIYLYLNRIDKVENYVDLILDELRKMDLEGIAIPEEIGELLSKSEALRED